MAKKRANLGPSLLTNRVYTRALHVSIFVSLTSLLVIYISLSFIIAKPVVHESKA